MLYLFIFSIFSSSRYDDDAEIKDSDDEGDKPKDIDDPFKDTEASPKEQEEEEDPVQETRIDVEVPKISTNLGNDLHFVKLPNFLSIESRPFDAKGKESMPLKNMPSSLQILAAAFGEVLEHL